MFSVLQLLCIIVENEEDIAAFKDYTDSGELAPPAASSPRQDAPPPSTPAAVTLSTQMPPPAMPQAPPQLSGRIFASPLAKKLASEKGIDLVVSHE